MRRQLAVLFAIALLGVSVSAQSRRAGNTRGITVFTNPDFRGESATFRNDTPDIRGYGLNDKISSIDVPNGETWEICQDVNYGNRCQVLSGSISDLRQMGWNDRISSLRRVGYGNVYGNGNGRPGGVYGSRGSLRFYSSTNFRGSSALINGDTSNLNSLGRPRSVEVQGGGVWQLCDRSGRCATITQSVSDLSRIGLQDRLQSANLINDRGNNSNRRSGVWR